MLGAAVAAELLVARTDDTACLVRHVSATQLGIAFVFVVRLREPMPSTPKRSSGERFWRALDPLLANPDSKNRTAIRFRVEFSDGSVFRPRTALWGEGASGDPLQAQFNYWLAGLPPPGGSVAFVVDWQVRGSRTPEARSQVDLSWRPRSEPCRYLNRQSSRRRHGVGYGHHLVDRTGGVEALRLSSTPLDSHAKSSPQSAPVSEVGRSTGTPRR
jgi:hypothetical protein